MIGRIILVKMYGEKGVEGEVVKSKQGELRRKNKIYREVPAKDILRKRC
jgi:hypothetical protein